MTKAYIKQSLEEAFVGLGVDARRLTAAEAAEVRRRLESAYTTQAPPVLHWNNFKDYDAVQHPESWGWMSEYLSEEPALLLFNEHDEPSIFRVTPGKKIVDVLGACPWFDFYISDDNQSFLLSENDHDYLYGLGAARDWVRSLAPRHEQWAASLGSKDSDTEPKNVGRFPNPIESK